jgi:membrane protease YdiL (CAAX protease family)
MPFNAVQGSSVASEQQMARERRRVHDQAMKHLQGWLRDPLFLVALVGGTLLALLLRNWLGPPAAAGSAVLLMLTLVPLLEELAFRGALQPMLLRVTGGRRAGPLSLANLLTSLGFCALHALRRPAALAAGVFLPSLVFGWFRERHDSVLPPLLLHLCWNAAVLAPPW